MVTLQPTRLWLAETLSVISFLAVFKQNCYFLIRFSFIFHTIILNMTFYAQQFNNIKWKIYIFIYKCFIWFVHFFYNNADCAISSKSKIKLKRYVQSMQHLFSPYFKALKVYKRLLLLFIEDTPESYQSTPGLFVRPMRRSNKFVYSF